VLGSDLVRFTHVIVVLVGLSLECIRLDWSYMRHLPMSNVFWN